MPEPDSTDIDVPHLRLPHTEKSLFISEIDFDVPALEVRFDDLAGIQFGVGANEKGGMAVEKLRAFAEAVVWASGAMTISCRICSTPAVRHIMFCRRFEARSG